MKYKKHFEELEVIVRDIESGEVAIDLLATKIKRAQKLIEICQKILSDTQSEVDKLLVKSSEKAN